MNFISLHFIVFFIMITLLFFRFKSQKSRIGLLLAASCYFYMSFIPWYIYILGGVIVVDFFAGIQIEEHEGRNRRLWMMLSIVANIGILCVFKYYNFFIENIHDGFLLAGKQVSLPVLKIALPLGLSFHTFQAMSYTIEVYRKNQKAERNFGIYALYVLFYPQLEAGPIERPQNILPQLKEFRPYNWENVKEGLVQMLWGFFKKAVIADRLAMMVDHVYDHSAESSSLILILGAGLFYFQLYCDFSGYSDIALGAAKVMNIKLMENFNQPFFSKNVSEFWRRWHISLSSWLNDYLFNNIIISIRNWGKGAIIFSTLLTFLICGFWHGAGWKFILFGLMHGLAIVYEYFTRKKRKKLFKMLPTWFGNAIAISSTYLFVVFSLIFFRAPHLQAAWDFIRGIFCGQQGNFETGLGKMELAFSMVLITIMLAIEKFRAGYEVENNTRFYLAFASMVIICYLFGVFSENQFIYFQF